MELQDKINQLEEQVKEDKVNYENLKSALENTPWHNKDRKKIAADKLRIGSRIQMTYKELKQRRSELEMNLKFPQS